MLKNLYKTWEILAPDEIRNQNNTEYVLLKTKDWEIYTELESFYLEFQDEAISQDLLLGYIQRCIEARQWSWMIVSEHDGCTVEFDATVLVGEDEYLVKAKTIAQDTLLTAYLTALAAQRPITKGQWQHFKGGEMDVLGAANNGICGEDHLMVGVFTCEEKQSHWLELQRRPDGTLYYLSRAGVSGSRVFYSHNGKNWSRPVDSFLGLVGAEHPESEGLLRFVEVGH
jgi:hypothetical protein